MWRLWYLNFFLISLVLRKCAAGLVLELSFIDVCILLIHGVVFVLIFVATAFGFLSAVGSFGRVAGWWISLSFFYCCFFGWLSSSRCYSDCWWCWRWWEGWLVGRYKLRFSAVAALVGWVAAGAGVVLLSGVVFGGISCWGCLECG